MRFVGFLLLAACGDSAPSLTREVACPDCAPDEVRFALHGPHVQASSAALDVRGDGTFAYITDHAVFLLDRSLAEQAHATLDHDALAVASNGDSIYVLEIDTSKDSAASLGDRVLSGFDPGAHRLWSADLSFGSLPAPLAADSLGAYTASAHEVSAFGPDGSLRTTFLADQIICALRREGLVSYVNIGIQSTFASLFPTGGARWSHTWRVIDGSTFKLIDAATSDAGRIAIAARFIGQTLDLDGTRLAAPSAGTFEAVGLLDAGGTLLWATLLGSLDADLRIAVTSDDQVVLGGSFQGDGSALGLPAADGRDDFFAVIDASGVARAELIGGPGDQDIGVLRAGTDGTVVLTVVNSGKFTIGAHAFRANADYLIELVP